MTLLVETPDSRASEREYILSVLLGEFLGLNWQRKVVESGDVRITVLGQPGEIRLPDRLFSLPDSEWLAFNSIPLRPLPCWDTGELGLEITLIESTLPVIYGDLQLRSYIHNASTYLPLDIFGSAFFMLTCYEEMVAPDRDEHDRFPAWASLAYKQGFLERPIIDEYVEILWSSMLSTWPGLERKRHEFSVKVSHDVDRPSRYGFQSPGRVIRAMAGDVLSRHYFWAALGPWVRLNTKRELHPKDPYNTFNWLMDVSEKNGLTSAFYFIAGKTYLPKDADYSIDHPAVRALMRNIHLRGHEIGLHPSYGTYKDPSLIQQEAEYLRRSCFEEGIEQSVWGGRMHFLRWEANTTMQGWEQAGMTYDSTLGYADHVGFRCGTCQEYTAFDLFKRRPLRLHIRPLVAMEASALAKKYMALDFSAAREKLLQLKQTCKKMEGNFTLLWHNSELATPECKALYEDVVGQ